MTDDDDFTLTEAQKEAARKAKFRLYREPVDRKRPVTVGELESVFGGLVAALKESIGKIADRLKALETQTKALEDRPLGVIDRGVWNGTAKYEKHEAVTHRGSYWIAQTANVSMKPGHSSAWRLAVQRGRDATRGETEQS